MTTRRAAEGVLFDGGTTTRVDHPERRRLSATYCPRCRGWVEVRLRPVRLSCTRCGLEARP